MEVIRIRFQNTWKFRQRLSGIKTLKSADAAFDQQEVHPASLGTTTPPWESVTSAEHFTFSSSELFFEPRKCGSIVGGMLLSGMSTDTGNTARGRRSGLWSQSSPISGTPGAR